MAFFHNCIDFERRNEINKQELVLSEDFSIYNVFKALVGPGRKFLELCDLQTIIAKHFECQYTYKDVKLAVLRQGGEEQMRYTDYVNLVKPRSHEFSDYVNRKMHDSEIGFNFDHSFGMKDATKQRFGKLFREMIELENELELQRKYKISQIDVKEVYRSIDTDMKGFCTLSDYYAFFESKYCSDLPVSTEEVTYLFKRHDRMRQGRVT